MEGLFAGNEHEDSEFGKGADRIEDTKKDKKEHDKEEHDKEARQGNRNKEEGAGRTGRTDEQEEQKELPRLVPVEDEEQPEQLLFEVKESKKKKTKTKKKTASKVKDEIKLALVSVYALAGATLDECFYLKPNEADLLTEAIYRYLEEHNLIHAISEKSATLNLIIVLVSVNLPKFTEYYKNLKNKERSKGNGKEREAKPDNRQSANNGQPDVNNAKAHLDQFYNPDEG